MKKKNQRFQFFLMKDGTTYPWTGYFNTIEEAKEWRTTHGEWWIKEGKEGFIMRTQTTYLCA